MKKSLFITCIVIASITKQSQAQIITTIAGTGTAGYSGDGGQATAAQFMYPTGLCIDKSGNLFVADYSSNTVRKIKTTGIISTIAGNNTQGNAGDGGQATVANLYDPTGVAKDANGNIYIADDDNNKIRKVTGSGIINTFAGDGFVGYYGDTVQATTARLSSPWGITIDKHKSIFFADLLNHCIRKIDSLGVITTVVGTRTAGYIGDGGQASMAQLNYPANVVFDGVGNLYIVDRANNVIRKVNTAGIITTVAGNNTQGYSGDGGQATLAELGLPFGMDVDAAGNMYIADQANNVIRKVTSAGIISTIAGNGTQGFSGDGGPANLAELNLPRDVKVDTAGNLYIADSNNSRIRKVSIVNTTHIESESSNQSAITVYPNPVNNILNVECLLVNEKTTLSITDMLGNNVKQIPFNTQHVTLNIADLSEGVYNLSIIGNEGVINKRIVLVK